MGKAKNFTADLADLQAQTTANFISTTAPQAEQAPTNKRESKSKRLQLVLKPSFFKSVQEFAGNHEISVNALFATAVADYMNRNK